MARSSPGGYLPPMGGTGPMFGPPQDPETSGPGKSIKTQHMGSVIGRRGAGTSQITGGDQGAHAMNHYGKGGIKDLMGGTL
jgi:hypothetical protein